MGTVHCWRVCVYKRDTPNVKCVHKYCQTPFALNPLLSTPTYCATHLTNLPHRNNLPTSMDSSAVAPMTTDKINNLIIANKEDNHHHYNNKNIIKPSKGGWNAALFIICK